MKQIFLIVTLIIATVMAHGQKSFHDFTVKDINGNDISLSQFVNKKVLVVNTASKCGYTKQYKDLEQLYQQYGGDNFVVIGFPANNFLNQEPGTNEEIMAFCTNEFGVTFPMMSKIDVKSSDMHPLYEWLTQKSMNGVEDAKVKWNFQKFMIDENGQWVDFAPPSESPLSDRIVKWIKE